MYGFCCDQTRDLAAPFGELERDSGRLEREASKGHSSPVVRTTQRRHFAPQEVVRLTPRNKSTRTRRATSKGSKGGRKEENQARWEEAAEKECGLKIGEPIASPPSPFSPRL